MAKRKALKRKHVPMRLCIATGQKKTKSELIRFVRTEAGKVEVDPTGKKKGRGANLTADLESFDLALKKMAFKRALKLDRALTEMEGKRLREEFIKIIEEKKFRPGKKAVTIRVKREDFDRIREKDLKQ